MDPRSAGASARPLWGFSAGWRWRRSDRLLVQNFDLAGGETLLISDIRLGGAELGLQIGAGLDIRPSSHPASWLWASRRTDASPARQQSCPWSFRHFEPPTFAPAGPLCLPEASARRQFPACMRGRPCRSPPDPHDQRRAPRCRQCGCVRRGGCGADLTAELRIRGGQFRDAAVDRARFFFGSGRASNIVHDLSFR